MTRHKSLEMVEDQRSDSSCKNKIHSRVCAGRDMIFGGKQVLLGVLHAPLAFEGPPKEVRITSYLLCD
jgi:hypothetical protein